MIHCRELVRWALRCMSNPERSSPERSSQVWSCLEYAVLYSGCLERNCLEYVLLYSSRLIQNTSGTVYLWHRIPLAPDLTLVCQDATIYVTVRYMQENRMSDDLPGGNRKR